MLVKLFKLILELTSSTLRRMTCIYLQNVSERQTKRLLLVILTQSAFAPVNKGV